MSDDAPPKPSGPPPILLVPVAVLLPIALAFWVHTSRTAFAQQSWLPVRATVVSTELQRGAQGRISHNCSTADGRGPRQVYVAYSYSVADVTHTSRSYDALYDGELFCEEAPARERVAELQKAGSLTVYYDPKDPTRAAIVRQSVAQAYGVLALLGVVSIGFGGYFARQIVRYRRWRRATKSDITRAARRS